MMNEDNERKEASETPTSKAESQTGDPGRTPGTAEGDEETVDESLKQHERDQTE
jgi:hypothetical protein